MGIPLTKLFSQSLFFSLVLTVIERLIIVTEKYHFSMCNFRRLGGFFACRWKVGFQSASRGDKISTYESTKILFAFKKDDLNMKAT